MRAKINTLIILIAIFAAALVASLFAGCGEESPKDRADRLGMTACVTYYTNGGSFVSGTNPPDQKAYRTDYYKPGTPLFNIGVDETSGQSLTIKRDNYIFLGWEYAELDENGLPMLYEPDADYNPTGEPLPVLKNGTASIIDSTGREMLEKGKRFVAVSSGEKVFVNGQPRRTVGSDENKYEHLYLVATWEQDVMLEYKLVTDSDITVEGEGVDTVTYTNGDTIYKRGFAENTSLTLFPDEEPVNFKNFSYISLYWDEECTNLVKTGDKIEKHTDKTNSVIYAKYLSGDWKAVRTDNDVSAMLSSTLNTKYYLVDDIDCSASLFSLKTGSFGGTIEGNGKRIYNISVDSRIQNVHSASILGTLSSTAKVRNLKIENVNINLRLNGSMYVYALVTDVEDGAVLENVILDNVTLSITKSGTAKIENIQESDGVYDTANWLYGVYGTDAEFESAYDSVKVKNAVLIINDKEIVSNQEDIYE